ncbi:hemagglutinin repeat-containing protein [Haemophilus parainfluenzae]|uniref:two-partner secretion domain-containing protein n=1 Tax=Haemophilus parainfluenzae TaxID=729 RepID=UPI0018A5488A|nr:hemagglutinin repeat-containing protein [Haemophilus parainfluenzae]QOR19722.1 hemagglutinin repeat-containing protein [Haemophilus parainfluenzae]
MNKRHYKVIFSRVLNQLVVVSELAKSQGKAQSENVSSEQEKTGLFSSTLSLNPIHFSLMLALGFVFLSPSVHAEDMAIRADKSAPGNQQPTVLQTGNGLPQVNIQTPSAGGVSRNQYSQFDVAEKGAVLNNARKAAQTQMAGWVQGNPNLARGEAKVILNEVNSANPSRLKGYVEVAGKKADVVIANPSGIQCDGCGVINAGRTTLTTGKAEVENGELKGYRVKGGKVTVGQKGMDNSQSDYTDIIAEKAEIKGGVWSKKGIKVTTGKNNVDRTNDSVVYVGDKNTDNTDRTSDTQGENQSYSVDVSQLGGMYAEKIHLVDNGQGLGVRNAGHIGASAGSVKIDSQGKIVNEGFIGGSENAELNAKKNIENRGTVYAKAQTQLNAQHIDNKQGVIAGKQVQLNANNVDNRKQSDKGSLIVATEKASIKAKHVDNQGTKAGGNTEQGIRGAQVAITAENLSNQQGGIYSDEHTQLDVAQTIDNKQGEIEAGKSIELKAKTLANEGDIKTKGDLTVRLQDSLTLNNAFQVGGNLDFKTEGDFKNNSQLRVGNKVDVKAANVENTQDAEISGNETRINTNTLTNRGLIDGALTVAKAVTINNLGTGRIYGDHVALQGENLNNLEEGDKSAVIAARERLDVGVDKVLNRNESTLLSMGKIYVGKALDENNQATGKSAYVQNYNGVIEALNLYDNAKSKAITFNTGKVENKHFFLETENVDTSSTPVFEYRIGNDSTIYGKDSGVYKVKQDNKSGRWGLNRKIRDLYHIFSPDGKIESDNWHEYDYTRTVNETVVLNPKYQEGKILSGGGIDFNDARVDNQDSKVIAGGLIQIADGQLHNDELKGRTIVTDAGRLTAFYKGKKKRKWDRYDTTKSDTSIYYKQNESVKDLGVFAYKENVAPEFTNNSVANKGDAGDVVLNHLTQSLDKSSLYHVNPNAPKGYVIETDPRFANKQKWLSSDYMFNALRYDSNNMLKRLGDGFYELRLVNEQINQLTGRRYLDGYQNALEQYKGLMNNGIRYAKQFNLVPGVGLTKEQMAELTTDLVWMVNQEITLPSGKKINVLTPKIYLASNRTQVTPTGSVISGDSIVGSVKDMTNEGTVLAANLVNLYGQNLENKGLVLANNVNLNAKQKLVNLGGKIVAADSLSLYGGKSVELAATTTETQNQLGRTETGNRLVDRQSEVTVTGKDGKISIQSDGDITVKAAKVKSAGTVDVNAKGKLLVTTEKQSSKEHYDFSDNHHYHLDKEGEVSSVIEGKDGVRLIGQEETTLRQAKVSSEDGKMMVASKGDVLIEEGRDIEHLDRRNKQTLKGFLTKETEERRHHHDYDLAKGSRLQGKNVEILSQTSNVSVKGSDIQAKENIHLQGNQVRVTASLDKREVQDSYSFKKSGLDTSGKGGVMRIGYQRGKLNNNGSSYNESVNGSELVAKNGNLSIYAQQDVDVDASRLASGKDMSITGKNVHLNAMNEQHDSEYHQEQKSTGFGMGFVYDPVSRAKENYRQKEAQGATKSVVGKAIGVSDAVADSIESMVRGIQPYANHNRSESNKYNQKTEAQITSLEAGGKLNIHAREGDIRTQGSNISAEGDAQFIAAKNVDFGVAVHEQSQHASSRQRGVGVDGLAKYMAGVHTQRENGDTSLRQEVGTQISIGGKSTTIAENGDITLKGTTFVSNDKNILQANNGDVKLLTAETTDRSTQMRKGHSVGEAAISDTERFFGYNRTRMNQDGEQITHKGSQLASLNSTVDVYAGKDYLQTASEVLAKEKVNINAQNITINNAINHQDNSYSESDLKIGQFSRVKSPIIDLINTIEGAAKNDKASDRLKAANVMSVAAQGYNLYNAFSKMATKDPKSNTYLLRVESGSGVAHSRQSQESLGDISQGSRINAKEINLIARGDGSLNEKGERQLGNINLTHTDLTSRDENGNRIKDSKITLTGNELNIKAGESYTQFKGRNQSVGVEAGVAATVGAQTGVGVYARVGGSSGKEDGESKTYQASHLEAQTVTLNSQGDTNLIGSQVAGNKVNANVGGKLNIESLQDEERFKTKSSGGGLEVEFGFGNNWSLSGYGNASKGTTHRKQVNEQAGIFAEEGGYHINADSVHLKGGAIASTNPKNSELATNKLTFEDIQNESSSSAASASVSGSIKESKEKWVDNETGRAVKPNTENSTKLDSQRSGGISPGLPMFERDSDSSVTRATLTEGTIILNKDTHPTITTAKELGINTDLAQANNQVAQTKDVKAQIQEQQQISTAIGNVKSAVDTYTSNKLNEAETAERRAKAEYDKAQANNASKDELNFLEYRLREAKREVGEWGYGGGNRRTIDTVTALFTGVLSGQGASATTVATLSPTVNKLIADNTHDKATNALAHAVWGAIEAQVNGGRAAHGAISAAGAELLAPQIASILYGKSEADLTPDEKAGVISMASLAGGIAGAIMNGKSEGVEIIGNTAINAQIAENTVTNNYLSEWQAKQRDEEFAACNGSLRCELKTGVYWELVSSGQDTAYGAGLATSIPVGLFETGKGIAEIAMHPIDSLNAIKTLIQEGNFTEAMKQSYANRIDKMIVEYEKAGAEGAFKAGLEAGQLLQETAGILAGGAGLAKVGIKLTKTATNLAKNVVKHEGKVINVASSVASTVKETTTLKPKPEKTLNIVCGMGEKCFVAGTLIETVNGLKPIEEIQYGELIWSREEFGEKYAYKPVFANKVTLNQETFKVVVKNEDGKTESFVTTAEHPFFVEGKGWLKAILLEEDMVLLDRNGLPSLQVVSQQATGKLETVYNIAVEEFSTYHVGEFGVWVHNANCCDFVNVKYGDIEAKFKQGGWVNPKNDRVMYIDPFDGKFKDFPDGARASVDHILPQSAFNKIDGFDKLPKHVQNELINHPKNLQPLPKELNSSKGAKIETGTKGWQRYVKDNKDISPLYRKYLADRQDEIRAEVLVAIEKFGVNK